MRHNNSLKFFSQKIGRANLALSTLNEEQVKCADFSSVEEKVGILASNILNYPVKYETFRFEASLLSEVFMDHGWGYTKQRLYAKRSGGYLVYVERDHNHDYRTSYLAGAWVDGEEECPLSVAEVQERFPELATKAGLSRVTNI